MLMTVLAAAFALSAGQPATPVDVTTTLTGCLQHEKGVMYNVQAGSVPMHPCEDGDNQISFNQTGPQGPAGPPGAPATDTHRTLVQGHGLIDTYEVGSSVTLPVPSGVVLTEVHFSMQLGGARLDLYDSANLYAASGGGYNLSLQQGIVSDGSLAIHAYCFETACRGAVMWTGYRPTPEP